jgi:murein DD-endopeptidase MepM/ murein hydrolase activator NlpD
VRTAISQHEAFHAACSKVETKTRDTEPRTESQSKGRGKMKARTMIVIGVFAAMLGEKAANAASIPSHRCPLANCQVGGFGFGDNWTFGRCPVNGPYKKHTGLDLRAAAWTSVYSVADGRVADVYDAGSGWAQAILVESPGGSIGRWTHEYMHIVPLVRVGDLVHRGQLIAWVAPISTPHLHYGDYDGLAADAAAHRGALPRCSMSLNSCSSGYEWCFDGVRWDPGFPYKWVYPAFSCTR